jgi:hypothetical protein
MRKEGIMKKNREIYDQLVSWCERDGCDYPTFDEYMERELSSRSFYLPPLVRERTQEPQMSMVATNWYEDQCIGYQEP